MPTDNFNEINSAIATTAHTAIDGLQVIATAVSEFAKRFDTPALRAFAKLGSAEENVRVQRRLLRRYSVRFNKSPHHDVTRPRFYLRSKTC